MDCFRTSCRLELLCMFPFSYISRGGFYHFGMCYVSYDAFNASKYIDIDLLVFSLILMTGRSCRNKGRLCGGKFY